MRRTLLTTCLILTPLAAQGGREIFQFRGDFNYGFGGFGSAIAVVGDINNDGYEDVAVADPWYQYFGGGNGRVELVSGADGSSLGTLTTSGPVGDLVAGIGDVNGDSVPDVVTVNSNLGGPYGGGSGSGEVWVLSGADSAVLRQISITTSAVAGVGDWNNDAVPDLAIENAGAIEIYDVVTGGLITTVASGGSGNHAFASAVDGASSARLLVVATGGTVTAYDSLGGSPWNVSGFSSVAPGGDYNGDQIGDVVGVTQAGLFTQVLSGADGSVLLTVPDSGTATGGVDLNGDLVLDVAIGGGNSVRAYSGADGSTLFTYTGWESGDALGWAVAMLPSAGPSMRPVVVAGAPNRFNGIQEAGYIHAFAVAMPGEVEGRVEVSGQRCAFNFATLRPFGAPPKPGSLVSLRFDDNTGPGSFLYNLHVFGLSDTVYGSAPLPLPLPGPLSCAQLTVSADVVELDTSSFLQLQLPISPTIVGIEIFAQALNLDLFSGFNFQSSETARILIGN